jgi:hypothetical protein
MESEMPGASSALNQSASALAHPCSWTGSSVSASWGACAASIVTRSASVVRREVPERAGVDDLVDGHLDEVVKSHAVGVAAQELQGLPKYRSSTSAVHAVTARGTIAPPDLRPLKRAIRIERTLTDVYGHLAFGEPKTRAARRTVSIPAWLVEVLAEHLATQPWRRRPDLHRTRRGTDPAYHLPTSGQERVIDFPTR